MEPRAAKKRDDKEVTLDNFKCDDGALTEAPLVQLSDLMPGDVLLYRPREPDRLQQRVTAATNSPYTHAAIYLGEKTVAESVIPDGVLISELDESLDGSLCVGVLRTQMVFGEDRWKKLREFVSAVTEQGVPFHRHALVNFGEKSSTFFDDQLDYVQRNYGEFSTAEQLAAKAYFCSGFVVACYQATGIIESSAQVAYPPEYFSPAHLYADATFGWLVGYLVPEGGSVPSNDPLLLSSTLWRDIDERPWWAS